VWRGWCPRGLLGGVVKLCSGAGRGCYDVGEVDVLGFLLNDAFYGGMGWEG